MRYVDVDLRPSNFLYLLLTFLTCGLYALCMRKWPNCCPRRVDVDRGRLIITSAGRIGLWRNVQAGVKRTMTNLKFQSNVKIVWYTVKNLTSVHVSRSFSKRLFAIIFPKMRFPFNESCSIRLFFNTFPRCGVHFGGALCGAGGPQTVAVTLRSGSLPVPPPSPGFPPPARPLALLPTLTARE